MNGLMLSDEQIRLNRLDLMSRLADDLSHEIKNPLHAMVINLELVKRRVGSDATDALERVAIVEREVHQVHDLVDGLLRLVRPGGEPGELTDVDSALAELEPVLLAAARMARAELELDTDELFARVRFDSRELKQALLDAFLALLDALPSGDEAPRRLSLHATRTEETVHVRLRAAVGGADLDDPAAPWAAGLALGRAMVERAGGRLDAERAGDAGELHLSLPTAS